MYLDFGYLLLTIVTMVMGLATQAYINSAYNKWSKVPSPSGLTGAAMAQRMLQTEGASSVSIVPVAGRLTDHYDPRDNNLHLSSENLNGGSVASVAVACHEAGHAVQTARGYAFGRFRTALVPVVNLSQQLWGMMFMAGIFLDMMGLVKGAILLFGFSVLFHLVTLPVEIDASRRAVAYLSQYGASLDQQGAREVLTAAALTYVAAALSSLLQLLYLLGQVRRRGDR